MKESSGLLPLEQEMGQARLGDRRLNRRLIAAVGRLSDEPAKSFPQAFEDDAAGLEALYRLVNNPKLSTAKVLQPHAHATVARCVTERVVLAIHDTSSVAFQSESERDGLGPVDGGTQGLYLHTTLMASATEHYRPLGVAAMKLWARQPIPDHLQGGENHYQRKKARRLSPDKESLRWKEQIDSVEQAVAQQAQVLHVGDSETDDYDLLAHLVEKGFRFVLRQKHNRSLEGPPEKKKKLIEAIADASTVATREVHLSARTKGTTPKAQATHPPRNARDAKLQVGWTRVSLKRPDRASTTLPTSLPINVVFVLEKDCPVGEDPIQWVLYTTEPVDTEEQLLQVVDYYRGRWLIEMYFDALKNGCALEKRQLESFHALSIAIGLFAAIAFRLLLMRTLAESKPDTPATAALSPLQLDVLRASLKKTKLSEAPTAKEVFWAVAALGGHLKHNGRPGWRTLGRGYEKLLILEAGWRGALKARSACSGCPGTARRPDEK
ncbi:MAG: IS4 family transposase [Myxococcales bacterium]